MTEEVGIVEQDIEKLPSPWFGIDHGIDNYEVAIRLDRVQAFRASFEYLGENLSRAYWNVTIHIVFENGTKFQVNLTEKGYDKFLLALKNGKKGGIRCQR